MQQQWMISREPIRSIVYVTFLILSKLFLLINIWSQGFISVSADEFARGIRAAKWSMQPTINILVDVKDNWLPFEKYLNGSLLMIWPDVIWVPRLTTFIASCLVLITFFMLVYYLFDSFPVAALASAFVVAQPWYTWLSGTPMLEMYYFAFFWAGLLFLSVWIREKRQGYWFWAGFCFMLASGFHPQSWVFINVVNLGTLHHLYQYFSRKQFKYLLQMIVFYVLGNAFVIAYTVAEQISNGYLFMFLSGHTSYAKSFYSGYDISASDKLLYYPTLIVHHSSLLIWPLCLTGIVFLIRDQARERKLFPLAIFTLALSINSVMNLFSAPATAAPGRYSLLFVMMVSPYLAYGTHQLWMISKQWSSRIMAYTLAILSTFLFLYCVGWGLMRIADFPRGMSLDAVDTGYYLKRLLSQSDSEGTPRFMVELKYWDFLGVLLTAGHYNDILYDRDYDPINRNTPSVLHEKPDYVCTSLRLQRVQYVVVQDLNLKTNIKQMDCLNIEEQIGSWAVYKLTPAP